MTTCGAVSEHGDVCTEDAGHITAHFDAVEGTEWPNDWESTS